MDFSSIRIRRYKSTAASIPVLPARRHGIATSSSLYSISREAQVMQKNIRAIYLNGVFHPLEEVDLKE